MESLVNTVAISISEERLRPEHQARTSPEPALKIDLSNISYLKPKIMNPKTYELAHKGFLREERIKTDAVR